LLGTIQFDYEWWIIAVEKYQTLIEKLQPEQLSALKLW
jgi:hypothetical protein